MIHNHKIDPACSQTRQALLTSLLLTSLLKDLMDTNKCFVYVNTMLMQTCNDPGPYSQVSEAGDALYAFPSNFGAIIQSRSFWLRIAPLVNRIKETAGWLARVSFGAALVSSVALVWITIIALMTASSQDNDRNNNRLGSCMII